jgi:hypothetical protein
MAANPGDTATLKCTRMEGTENAQLNMYLESISGTF